MTLLQVVIPWIGPPDLLDGCLESMAGTTLTDALDIPILVVDNTADQTYTPYIRGVEMYRAGRNLGIAASWNLGLARNARWTILASACMRFNHGLFATAIQLLEHPYGTRTNHAWHLHSVGRECVNDVGTFDELFYPCEYEDTDYMRRMMLAGIPYHSLPSADDADAYCVGNSVASGLGLVPKSEEPRLHYVTKWGGEPGSEAHNA